GERASPRPHALPALRARQARRGGPPGRRVPRARRHRARRPAGSRAHLRRPLRRPRALGTGGRRQRGDPRGPVGALAGARMSDDDHHHPAPLSPVEVRARALEELLTEKGLVHGDTLDAVVSAYENDIGPLNGAKVVARAWVDPEYRRRLLADGTAAI